MHDSRVTGDTEIETTFLSLLGNLSTRYRRGLLSYFSIRERPLRDLLDQAYSAPPGTEEALLSDPVFEAKFGYHSGTETLDGLARSGKLDPDLVQNLDAPPPDHRTERLARVIHPYTHQLEAWSLLGDSLPRSVVVSAGTGSGKTECFLVPILDDLARQARTKRRLVGVQALFLYPLNALINSQRARLTAWTRGFGGRIRFCLYNGNTPKVVPASDKRRKPEEVLDRKSLREDPPPILLTNATMLEYMLVRPEDHPILEASKGGLKYVVIDEAHTYLGSQAAELALLLRRVLSAFDVTPDQVRFVATSATIASHERDSRGRSPEEALRRFMASISGQGDDQIHVVFGHQMVPPLPQTPPAEVDVPSVETLTRLDPEERFARLVASRKARALRNALAQGAMTLSRLTEHVHGPGRAEEPSAREETVALLDCMTTAAGPGGVPFLPLRMHLFVRTQPGLWACVNPACSGREDTPLMSPDWPFGKVFFSRHTGCDACGAMVYEVVFCRNCGMTHLAGILQPVRGLDYFVPENGDVFESAIPDQEEEGIVPEDGGSAEGGTAGSGTPEDDGRPEPADEPEHPVKRVALLAAPPASGEGVEIVDVRTGLLGAQDGAKLRVHDPSVEGEDACRCGACGGAARGDRPFWMPARNIVQATQSLLMPGLLEWVPPRRRADGHLPFDGRRLITFSDSRQGTARFAASTQWEAERNYVRSLLYGQVWEKRLKPDGTAGDAEKHYRQLLSLREAVGGAHAAFDSVIAQARKDMEKQKRFQGISLGEAIGTLEERLELGWMHRARDDYDPFDLKPRDLAWLLIVREFARRPARRRSLETLGLVAVSYPFLEEIHRVPDVWTSWHGTLEEWRDFLKLCLDFFVRANSALKIDKRLYRWMGTRIRTSYLLPQTEKREPQRVPWPEWRSRTRPPRLAALLINAFGRGDERADREDVNAILYHAWQALYRNLTREADGSRLDLEEVAKLVPVEAAWICPATGQLLDTTLRGFSPYQPPGLDRRSRPIPATRLPMPRPPFLFRRRLEDGEHVPLEEIRRWLDTDETVRAARVAGVWQQLTDRIVEGTRYFRVAEHSAQLAPARLEKYEQAFREGKINVLSCSTTMELGVDIGGLSAVTMNNAPPNPANFLQRSGRAGRRGEQTAVSVTVCRNLPHDMAVFRNPLWPFVTPMHVTDVSLDSERIVQRHVNAVCLNRFLLQYQERGAPIHRLHAGWFFDADADGPSVCDRFLDHLKNSARHDEALKVGIRRLVQRSVKAHAGFERLMDSVVAALDAPRSAYDKVRKGLEAELDVLDERERKDSPVALAIDRQLARHRGEYLLRYLATHQFLPGYGFPTHVAPLVTTTIEELRASARGRRRGADGDSERDGREDYRTLVRGFPTRDLTMALSEYVPGAEVVLDGRVYRSGGITLNWHLPPSPDEQTFNEIVDLSVVFTCRHCGHFEPSKQWLRTCPVCGSNAVDNRPYLVPAGFAVDIWSTANTDITSTPWFPPLAVHVSSGSGPFVALGRPSVVRLRHAGAGTLVYLSHGQGEHGYAVCLRCGRAASETQASGSDGADELPEPLQDHKRLRGGKDSSGRKGPNVLCEGNYEPFAIKRHIALGTTILTDVLELRFVDPGSGAPLNNPTIATTLAVALRQALAESLGIEDEELGYKVMPRTDEFGSCHAVLLFDRAAGGAGFCAEAPEILPQVLRRARARLECPNQCDSACHACLLGHDTQHSRKHLDRKAALGFLTPQLIQSLELPPELRCFGDHSALEWQAPLDAVVRVTRRYQVDRARVVLHGDPDTWDLTAWRGVDLFLQLARDDIPVELVLERAALERMDWQARRQLANLAEFGRFRVMVVEEVEDAKGASGPLHVFAECHHAGGWIAFATSDTGALSPGPGWLSTGPGAVNVHGAMTHPAIEARMEPLSPVDIRVVPPGTMTEVVLAPDAPVFGPARGFGRRFWEAVVQRAPDAGTVMSAGPASRVVYIDRYLRSPLSALGLYLVLQGLKDLGVLGDHTRVELKTSEVRPDAFRAPRRIQHDWTDPAVQRAVIENLVAWLGHAVALDLAAHPRNLPHARTMTIDWADVGRGLEVRFDQGVDFFDVESRRFSFDVTPIEQARRLKSLGGDLTPAGRFPVFCYLAVR